MKRYNIFNQVHKGLRALLFETGLAVQQCDFANEKESGKVLKQLYDMLTLFEKHADTENRFILPAIQEYEPSVVESFEQEHDEDHELGDNLRKLLDDFAGQQEAETKTEAGKAIYLSLVRFMVFNLDHMSREEAILNKILWRYYSDEQLAGITRQIIAGQPVEMMSLFSKWMMRGLNNDEIVNWLKEVKNKAPHFIFEGLLSMSRQELDQHRWLLLQEQLTEGAMLA